MGKELEAGGIDIDAGFFAEFAYGGVHQCMRVARADCGLIDRPFVRRDSAKFRCDPRVVPARRVAAFVVDAVDRTAGKDVGAGHERACCAATQHQHLRLPRYGTHQDHRRGKTQCGYHETRVMRRCGARPVEHRQTMQNIAHVR
jgi:hypothetical protein